MDQWSRRIMGFGVHRGDVDRITLCQIFNQAMSGVDPPYAPMTHPFIERVIGTIRREYLDHTPFWNSLGLTRKPDAFKDYYNNHRTHANLSG